MNTYSYVDDQVVASTPLNPAGGITSDDRVVPLADLFRLLGDPTRLRIVLACVAERRAVGAIAEGLGLSGSLVSHHLRLLRAARIVRAERQGKQVFYVAADRHISGMLGELLEHIAEPQPQDATDID
ncbi:hypothetical protein YK56LOC_50440 [Caballeronia sp. HLA56]